MTTETKNAGSYPVYDHDTDGHAAPDVEPGRVYYDEDAGTLVCSEHGNTIATDGTATRTVTEAPWEIDTETGQPKQNYDKLKTLGEARLYRCTVCGQGTWSHLG